MSEPYDTMDKLTEMFALVDTSDNDGIIAGFSGFVVPPEYIHPYGKVALAVSGSVTVAHKGTFHLNASFVSGDDSGLAIYAPFESQDKALKRLASFREFVDEWHPFMPPTFEWWEEWAQKNGVTANAW